jgi:transposase-like protein
MSIDTQFLSVMCPYCGEATDLVIDVSVAEQQYIEDCQVCCRPISVSVQVNADDVPQVRVSSQDEG